MQNILQKFNLNSVEFSFQFQSHADYPSKLVAFSDTLNFMGVKNETYELEKEYWEELPSQFMTAHNNDFAFVERENTTAYQKGLSWAF